MTIEELQPLLDELIGAVQADTPYDYTETLQELLTAQQMMLGTLWLLIGILLGMQVLYYLNGWRKW